MSIPTASVRSTDDFRGGIPATVLVVEPTGAEMHALMSIGSQTAAMVLHDRVTLLRVRR